MRVQACQQLTPCGDLHAAAGTASADAGRRARSPRHRPGDVAQPRRPIRRGIVRLPARDQLLHRHVVQALDDVADPQARRRPRRQRPNIRSRRPGSRRSGSSREAGSHQPEGEAVGGALQRFACVSVTLAINCDHFKLVGVLVRRQCDPWHELGQHAVPIARPVDCDRETSTRRCSRIGRAPAAGNRRRETSAPGMSARSRIGHCRCPEPVTRRTACRANGRDEPRAAALPTRALPLCPTRSSRGRDPECRFSSRSVRHGSHEGKGPRRPIQSRNTIEPASRSRAASTRGQHTKQVVVPMTRARRHGGVVILEESPNLA